MAGVASEDAYAPVEKRGPTEEAEAEAERGSVDMLTENRDEIDARLLGFFGHGGEGVVFRGQGFRV